MNRFVWIPLGLLAMAAAPAQEPAVSTAKAGKYRYACSMDMIAGTLVVDDFGRQRIARRVDSVDARNGVEDDPAVLRLFIRDPASQGKRTELDQLSVFRPNHR